MQEKKRSAREMRRENLLLPGGNKGVFRTPKKKEGLLTVMGSRVDRKASRLPCLPEGKTAGENSLARKRIERRKRKPSEGECGASGTMCANSRREEGSARLSAANKEGRT